MLGQTNTSYCVRLYFHIYKSVLFPNAHTDPTAHRDSYSLTFQSLAITLRNTWSNIKKFCMVLILGICVLYGLTTNSDYALHNISRLVLYNRRRVFTARYALSPYTTQTRLDFKRLRFGGAVPGHKTKGV